MTNEEAIEILKHEHDYAQLLSYVNEALKMAISAIEKQTPKKVNISLKGTTGWNTKCHCPICHSMVSHGKYCANCGQALDFNSDGSDTE